MKPRVCELCNGDASVYCISDSAFLCWDCDASVHRANFLVARHVRQILCCGCQRFDGNFFSGVHTRAVASLCGSCAADGPDVSDCDSSSSTCISSSASSGADSRVNKSEAARPPRRDSAVCYSGVGVRLVSARADARDAAVLEDWCRKLGLRSSRALFSLALRALETCLRRFTALPSRVCLAASLWYAANVCVAGSASLLLLRKLEACSGVPSKLILLAESKLRRILHVKRLKPQQEAEEGWAEC